MKTKYGTGIPRFDWLAAGNSRFSLQSAAENTRLTISDKTLQ